MDADAMQAALANRGPDGSGVWQSKAATLVHTRLAILDLSVAGAQPMEFHGGLTAKTQRSQRNAEIGDHALGSALTSDIITSSSVLAFNGEIYNHVELRKDLEAQGETFAGHSDTEVLLRLLVREGEACLPKLAGMFAFAFWDETSGTGLLARGALGIKPLYYSAKSGGLAFASEARVLKRSSDTLDADALRDFFLWGSVPEPATLTQEIRQLSAGHLLRWKDGMCVVEEWVEGRKVERPKSEGRKSEDNVSPAARIARAALEESMRRHLVADVPVGIFLSGGIDSTVVLALARQALGPDADIRTFSIGFDDPAFDESGVAKRTAEHFCARHTEWRMTSQEGAAEIPNYLAAVDQPTIDGFNTWCVSKLAMREGMKVVLSGLGGDEIFAGYGSFDRVPLFHAWYRRLGPLRGIAARLLDTRPAGTPWRRLASFFRGTGTWLEAYHAQRGIFTPAEAAQLAAALTGTPPLTPAFSDSRLPTSDLRPPPSAIPSSAPRALVSHLELTRYMRNQLLRDSDVFSMAHGLELRVPFVDQRFLNTIQQIPPADRLRQGKLLLLDAVPEVPEWVRNQAKRGFRFPFQQWMEGEFGELLAEAKRASPVPLNAWYRTWAVAVALRTIR